MVPVVRKLNFDLVDLEPKEMSDEDILKATLEFEANNTHLINVKKY